MIKSFRTSIFGPAVVSSQKKTLLPSPLHCHFTRLQGDEAPLCINVEYNVLGPMLQVTPPH